MVKEAMNNYLNKRTSRCSVYESVIANLNFHGIAHTILDHEPVYTMEQAIEACGSLPEQDVKVLFARTYRTKKKYDYCLIVWTGNRSVDFDQVAQVLSVKKVKLAKPEEVLSQLGVEIGALSPLGYGGEYPVVADKELFDQEIVYINPGVHNKTIKLSSSGLKLVLENSKSKFLVV